MKNKGTSASSLKQLKITVVIALFFLLAAFLPNIVYLGVRVGLIKLAQPTQVLGVNVEFAPGWFPIASRDSLLGGVLVANSTVPTVLFYKNDWLSPWHSSMVSISRLPNIGGVPLSQMASSHENSKPFTWGVAIEQPKKIGPIKIFFIPQYRMTIATPDEDALSAILQITAIKEVK